MAIETLRGSKPWIVMAAVTFLEDECLEPWGGPLSFRAFEWGAGGSTLWLSQRCATVISIEHDAEWHAQTGDELAKWGIENVTQVYRPLGLGYAGAILDYPDEAFAVIVVDGRERAQCLANAMGKLAPGGVLVLDDSERAQYQEAMGRLDGWERHDFEYAGKRTTVWRRHGDAETR